MSISNSRAISKMRSIWPCGLRVGIGRGADHRSAAPERLDHQLVGAGIVEQALLREDADLEVDRPLVLLDQRPHAFQPAQADAGIDLELRAHVRRAVEDRPLQRDLGAGVDVLGREQLLLPGHLADRLLQVAALGLAASQDARLVEVDVGLDEARRHQATAEVEGLTVGGELRLNDGDAALVDADVGCDALVPDHAGIAQDEVHRVASCGAS